MRNVAVAVTAVLLALTGAACSPGRAPSTRFVDAAAGGGPTGGPAPSSAAPSSPAPTASPTPPPAGTSLRGCPDLPPTNVWHAEVTRLPVQGNSAAFIRTMGSATGLNAD